MPKQLTSLKIRGLYSHPNLLSEVPEGALTKAQNCVIDREGLIGPRRGFPNYGTVQASESIRGLFDFDGTILAHYDGTLERDDGSGTFTAFVGDVTPPSGHRVHSSKSNGNFYFTSDRGLLKLDSPTGTIETAGVPAPLDGRGSTTGSSGFLADQANVGYRAVLFKVDANGNEIVSAPSQRLIVGNNAGGAATRDVSLTWYLPTGLTTDHQWRMYRSAQTATLADTPSDELLLVKEGRLSSTDISNGFVTGTDSTPDALRGEVLYTSPSREGIENANALPPLAVDIATFKGSTIYANITNKHRFFTALFGAGSTGLRFTSETGNTTDTSAVVTSIGDTSTLRAGMRAKGTGIPTTARILSVDSSSQVTLTENATATGTGVAIEFQDLVRVSGREYFAASATDTDEREFKVTTSGTPGQNVEDTALELVLAINLDSGNSTVYAFYTSGFEEIPGKMLFEERGIGGSSFQVSTTATESFSGSLPTTDDGSAVSKSDARTNFLAISKPDEPEGVPLGNRQRAGRTPIRRALSLRDVVILISDQILALVGTDVGNFEVTELDSTAKLIGPETAVVFNDAVYCMSDQGVVRIDTNGVQIVSRQIEIEVQQAATLSNFEDLAFAVGYESERCYHLCIPTAEADTAATRILRYNAITAAWTDWDLEATSGIVNPADNVFYLGNDAGLVRKQRRELDRTDYADEEYAVTISSIAGDVVTVNDSTGIVVNDLLVQGPYETVITAIDGNDLTLTDVSAFETGAATAYRPIRTEIEWVPATAGNAGVVKQFTEFGLVMRDANADGFPVSFSTDFQPYPQMEILNAENRNAWGFAPWGSAPWGQPVRGEQVLRGMVPPKMQRCHWMIINVVVNAVRENFLIAGISLGVRSMSAKFTQAPSG